MQTLNDINNEATFRDVKDAVSGRRRKLKVYKVLILHSAYSEEPHLRVFKLLSGNEKEAHQLASRLIGSLTTEQIQAISANAHEVGQCMENDTDIYDIWQSDEGLPGHAWSLEDVESDDFDRILENAKEELARGLEVAFCKRA